MRELLSIRSPSSYAIALRVGMLKLKSASRTGQIGTYLAVHRLWRAVKKHAFDPDMVVKPFLMAQSRNGTRNVQMECWCAVSG